MAPRRVALVLGIVVIAAVGILLAGRGESYAQRAAAACSESYDIAWKTPGPTGVPELGYFSTVIRVAEARMAGMSVLRPPAADAATHRAIIAADAELARSARHSAERLASARTSVLVQNEFRHLRALEWEQRSRFESIGIDDCSL